MAVVKVGKPKRVKKQSLLRKVIDVYWNQVQVARAKRILVKQTWSMEFLATVLATAAKMSNNYDMQVTITNKDGMSFTLTASDCRRSVTEDNTASILDQLDNDAAVAKFIRQNSRR